MRILLIEDDDAISEVIKRGLEEDKYYTVEIAADGRKGLRMAREQEYAVILLDLMLPGLDGWSVCQELRARRINTPILMLTARDTVRDKVRGLDAGADDYLAKPFEFEELLARVRALHRRDRAVKSRIMNFDRLEIDTGTRRVTLAGNELPLTQREYALLEALAINEGRPISRDYIQYQVWSNDDSYSNTVDVHIGVLRKKIDAGYEIKLIHTVHGLGYMLKNPTAEEEK